MWILSLAVLMLGTNALVYIYTLGARPEIESHDLQYASALYRSLWQQLSRTAYPVRASVLFLRTPPTILRGTIQAMRVVCAISYALDAIFFGIVVHELIA